MESQATLSTNDIVINKLTQILSYLRQGGKHGKKMKKTKDKEMPPPQIIPGLKIHKSSDDSIYGNIGTYQPTSKEKTTEAGSKERRSDKRFYFDDKTRKDKDETGTDKERGKDAKSDTVLEAERTLGALLKPGAADQITKVSRTHQRLFFKDFLPSLDYLTVIHRLDIEKRNGIEERRQSDFKIIC